MLKDKSHNTDYLYSFTLDSKQILVTKNLPLSVPTLFTHLVVSVDELWRGGVC